MQALSLRAVRVNSNMTQEEAARKLHISTTTLRNWETGRTFPRQPQIMDICKLFRVDYDNIFFGRRLDKN